MKDTAQEKRDTLERMLTEEHVLVHLAPQAVGVELPDHLRGSPTVTLKLSRHFRGRMEISAVEVSAELLFGERYFTCRVPFSAVWGMTSLKGQFLMWPDSAPAEVLATLEQQAQARKADALAAEAEASAALSTERTTEPQESRGSPDLPQGAEAVAKQRPKLRRIK